MKIEVFDFKRHWHLVEPHLNDPEVIELLNQGMRRFSLRDDRWAHLPIWDSENGHGPWEYSKSESHSQYASEHYFEDPDYEILRERYYNAVENMGVNLDENDLD